MENYKYEVRDLTDEVTLLKTNDERMAKEFVFNYKKTKEGKEHDIKIVINKI